MDNAERKVSRARNFLMRGRNAQGYLETRNRILTTARNYELTGQGYGWEPMKSVFRGFSEGPGLNAVANTTGIDVVDISIITAVRSFLPYLAVDRGMAKPTDLLTYQLLEAVNDAGGLKKGEFAVDPFAPINRNLSLSRSAAKAEETVSAGTTTLTVAFPIAKGKTRATFDGTVLGEDVRGDGKIYWAGPTDVSVTIDYSEGTIKLDKASAKDIVFEIYPDTTSEIQGTNTLKLRPTTKNITVTAEPNRVILETSMEQIAYMNRLLGNGIGNAREFGETALQQLLNAFIYWINMDLVTTTTDLAHKVVAAPVEFDMSSYYSAAGFDKFAGTKNDKLNQFILELNSSLLQKSNQGATYYLTGMMGSNILANSDKFVPTDLFNQQLNGVVGTYNGIPVLRHDKVTEIDNSHAGEAEIIVGHKDISGAAAPVIYGEYLPLYSTKAAVNFNNPTELSQAMFNMSKSAPLVENFISMGKIKFA